MKKLLLLLPIIFIISSCGYSSYNECTKEEIRKNDGKSNSSIFSYCREKFPKNTQSILLRHEVDYGMTVSSNGELKISNYSDQIIRVVKVVPVKCGDSKKTNWDDERNYMAGKSVFPGYSSKVVTYTDWSPNNNFCFYYHVRT